MNFTYEPLTGKFYDSTTKQQVGCATLEGYVILRQAGVNYQAHRVAVELMTGKPPVGVVDHRDGNGLNNVWTNLRDTTHQVNQLNVTGPQFNNTSGYPGVSKHGKKWRGRIMKDGKYLNLGSYQTAEAANKVVEAKRKQLIEELTNETC